MKLQYELLSYMNFFIITTATTFMIKGFTVDTSYDTVTISWDKPEYLPQSYKWDLSCTLACGHTVYTTQSVTVGSSETQDHISNLFPGSRCELKFFAVYNPASLDSGLVKTVYTKEKGEQNIFINMSGV